jgi:hypothetical protein
MPMNAPLPPPDAAPLLIRRLRPFASAIEPEVDDAVFVHDAAGCEAVAARCAGIVLAKGDEARAAALLAAGAPAVFLGETALLDSAVVERLASSHPGRVGIYAPVARQSVSWSLETVSNADFKTLAPSICEPSWEVLRADGSPTGTLLLWWLKALAERGAAHFLVAADIADDTDLNILAGLVEEFGERLWLTPRSERPMRPLQEWVAYGHCRRLALPDDRLAEGIALLDETGAANPASEPEMDATALTPTVHETGRVPMDNLG